DGAVSPRRLTMPEKDRAVSTEKEQYQQRVQGEIEHYAAEYANEESRRTLTQKVPPSWDHVEARTQELIRQANQGRCPVDELVYQMRARPERHMLSIGSGPGGVELEVARQLRGLNYEILCLDLN